jgi:hypothetical protein
MKNLKNSVLLMLLAVSFTACNGGGGGGGYVNDPYYGWYDQWGNECGNLAPGCNYWYPSGQWEDKILIDEDPYYYSTYPGDFEYYDYFYYGGTYFQDVWVSRTGIIYDSWSGDALNKNNDFASGRDVVTDVAQAEQKALESASQYYARKFGLSDDQGMKIAITLNDFATLQERTEQDISDFTKRLYGVDFNSLKPALDAAALGDNSKMTGVIETAASNFGTNPEAMRNVVKSLHGKLLEEAGISLE